ncbi:MAG TPA: hypothetical protein VGO25_07170 [Rhodanobacteraceae bacterium]|jgi:hypothetical protein|nr:hypothetical protein [Rhodanobacteraceae bacterium]
MHKQWFEVRRHHEHSGDDLRSRDILADIDKAMKRAEEHTLGFVATIHEELSQTDSAIVSVESRSDDQAAADSLKAALGSEHLIATPIDGSKFSI